jgi:hypothetical protein
MLEALLEPAPARPAAAAGPPTAGFERIPGAPDEQILAVLRGIPDVQRLLGGVVASWHSSLASLHSRRGHRIAYDKPLLITPLDEAANRLAERAFVAQGRDLSLSGFSFSHAQPLASRKVIVQFPAEERASGEAILAILRWCRFRRDGIYQSGGEFICTTPGGPWSPPAAPALAPSCGQPAAATGCSRSF